MKNRLTYKIYNNGYRIFKDGLPFVKQFEPNMPYKKDNMTYEEACLKHIEELCKPIEIIEPIYEEPAVEEVIDKTPTIHEQITDIELAIAELYEMVLGGTE